VNREAQALKGRRKVTALGPLSTLFNLGAIREMTDGQLLERFAVGGEAAELAFAALVERHGPVVFNTCRSILHDEHEAEDAFQATFLVLVRKAQSLWVRDSLGPWLHQVACHAARCSRSATARRTAHERRAAETGAVGHEHRGAAAGAELGAAIHEEIERMPERYRGLLILCDLEGRTYAQAARNLGCPVGTVKSRLARGRRLLGDRLTRRGFGVPTALPVAGLLPRSARAAPAPSLAIATTQAAMQIAQGRPLAEVVSAAVSVVVQGMVRGSIMTGLKHITLAAVVGALVGGLAWAKLWEPASDQTVPPGLVASRPVSGVDGPRPGEPEPRGAGDLGGQWEVVYLAGTVAGKREGYPMPGLLVPITDKTINLPALSGEPKSPIIYVGRMPFLMDPQSSPGTIDIKVLPAGEKVLKGIYRLRRDILTICYGEPDGERPKTFACEGPSESLIVLRPAQQEPSPVRQPGDPLPPPTLPSSAG
jgi:RNA polymerase sigma factor (sigma-70 family)